MASVTATARSERVRSRRATSPPSRIGRLIIVLNLAGLAVLVGGALLLNELRQGLVNARIESLQTEGQLITNVIEKNATVGDPEPLLVADTASDFLDSLSIPKTERVRLFDAEGHPISDSWVATDRVEATPLPPALKPGEKPFAIPGFEPKGPNDAAAEKDLNKEIQTALSGQMVARVRASENGGKVVSVSIPIQHVREVLGVLTLEAGDVDHIIAAERAALVPFIVIAIAVNLLSSFALTWLIAQPVRRLSAAADSVRLNRSRAIALPDIAGRKDELGDLARSLEDMTHTLSDRMEAIERFAADVAHEIRNPLTSIRSAVETLDLVKEGPSRDRLLGILKQDVGRLDRLITDISNASRLDAELSRESPRPVVLARVLRDIVALVRDDPRRSRSSSAAGGRRCRHPHRGRTRGTAEPGVPQSGRQRPFVLAAQRRCLGDPDAGAEPGGGASRRQRPRHAAGEPGDGVRAVLHLAAERRGVRRQFGARPFDRPPDHRGARRHDPRREPGERRRRGHWRPVRGGDAGGEAGCMILHAGLVALRLDGYWRGALIQGPSGAGKSDLALKRC